MFRKKEVTVQPGHTNTDQGAFNPVWSYLLIATTVLTALFRYALPVRDGDIWFHLAYAKYLIQNITLIPDHSVFSWTPASAEEIYCTWFADLVLYGIHDVFGLAGIIILRYSIIFFFLFLLFTYLRQANKLYHPLAWFASLLTIVMSYSGIIDKPTIFSYLFFAIYCWTWWSFRTFTNNTRLIYIFPLVMLVWVNSHGCFLFGCIFIFAVNAGELANTWLSPDNCLPLRKRKHLVIASVLAAIAIFITPYGYHYPAQLLYDTININENFALNSNISEYRSPYADKDILGFTLCVNIAVALLFFQLIFSRRKIEWSLIIVNIIFLLFYAAFYRTTFFWPLIFAFSSAALLALPTGNSRLKTTVFPALLVSAALAFSAVFFFRAMTKPELYTWMGFGISGMSAPEEVKFVAQYFPDAKLGNTYNLGSYLLWSVWPGNTVYMDARQFPFKDWIDDAFKFDSNKKPSPFMEKYEPEIWCVNMGEGGLLTLLNKAEEWIPVFYGNDAVVFAHEDLKLPQNLPSRGKEFSEQKNIGNSGHTLQWAAEIQDWMVADTILAAMKSRFKYSSLQRKIVNNAEYFIAANKAYARKDYDQTIEFFKKIEGPSVINNHLWPKAYIHQSISAWYEGNLEEAKKLNQEAWKIQRSYISLYNQAVMNWVMAKERDPHSLFMFKDNSGADYAWRNQFKEFLKITANNDKLADYKKTAEKLLNNSYDGIPYLMEP